MTTIGVWAGDYSVVSPDRTHVAVVVKRGNLMRNTVDYTLLVFPMADLVRRPKPDTVAQFASSSNRPGIVHVKWLSDDATLVFLGERPGELPQVYALDTRSRHLTQRTHATTVITEFDVAEASDVVVYGSEERRDTVSYAAMRAHGFVVPPRAFVGDLIAGDWGYEAPPWRARVLHVVRGGRAERTISLPDSAAGYSGCELRAMMTVAPHGDVAIVPCSPWTAPSTWERYRQGYFRAWSAGSVFPMYLVIDLGTGSARRLSGAPWDYSSATLVWAPDGQSVVVANDMLPLDVPDSVERMARATHKMVAEIDVHTGAITTIAHRDSLNVVSWDPRSATIELVPGARFGSNETVRLYYRKTVAGWVAASAAHIRATARVPTLVIDQGMNAPGRLVAVDPRTNGRYVVYDPNPGLMAAYRFAHEDAVHWRTKAGATWVGGLYWPLDYLKGHRYPLLIQTHGFDSTSFWPDGVYATGEAAQPLAGRGVMVLQMPMPPDDQWMTPREALLAQEGAEGAIDYLDSLGLIDRTQIGMQGFSRTSFYTLYFLTHSHYLIAAATVADGVDMGYLQNLVFQPMWIGLGQNEDVRINGGQPFGASLTTWRERAAGFNLDRVSSPLQLTALGRYSLLSEWEPYAGLLLQGKPAELVYIPDASHILTKPRERLTSQQGAVDWYLFWLKGEEDPGPAKAEQYARWHVLRAMRDSSTAKTAAAWGR